MKVSNVCKFVASTAFEELTVSRFIMETDASAMEKTQQLVENRLVLVGGGNGEITVDGTPYSVKVGDVFFAFAEEVFSACGKEFWYHYIDFKGARASGLFKRFSVGAFHRLFHSHDSLLPLWKEGLARADDHNIDLVAESILLYTFSVLKANKTGVGEVTSEMLALTEKHFTDSELSLSSLAEQMGYNAKYLSTLFKKQTGFSYSEYLRSLRIKYAVTLFDHGIESVRNVAFLSGFSDPLYFSTVFKKDVGVSPKEYVKK